MRKALIPLLVLGLLLLGVSPAMAAAEQVSGVEVAMPCGIALDEFYLNGVVGDFGPAKLYQGDAGGGLVIPLNPGFIDNMFKSVGRAANTVMRGVVRAAKAVNKFLDKTVTPIGKYLTLREVYRGVSNWIKNRRHHSEDNRRR